MDEWGWQASRGGASGALRNERLRGGLCQSSSPYKELVLGTTGWDDVVVSNLSKALLQDEHDYRNAQLKQADIGALFEGVGNNKEDFPFVAWSPHWMNQRYHFNYLDDPKGALGDLTRRSELEDVINEDGDPPEGARQWAKDNPDIVQPWLDTARAAQEA